MSCLHENFESSVEVSRLADEDGHITGYTADIRVRCAQCHLPFAFKGAPVGVSFYQPMASLDGHELRAPIEPGQSLLAVPLGTELSAQSNLN